MAGSCLTIGSHERFRRASPVAMRADPSEGVEETEIGLPLRKAPPPRVAVNASPRIGLWTTPTTTCQKSSLYKYQE